MFQRNIRCCHQLLLTESLISHLKNENVWKAISRNRTPCKKTMGTIMIYEEQNIMGVQRHAKDAVDHWVDVRRHLRKNSLGGNNEICEQKPGRREPGTEGCNRNVIQIPPHSKRKSAKTISIETLWDFGSSSCPGYFQRWLNDYPCQEHWLSYRE